MAVNPYILVGVLAAVVFVMDAAWLLVPAAAVVALFVVASLRALSPTAGPAAERVASVSFYGCVFVGAVILLGLLMFR